MSATEKSLSLLNQYWGYESFRIPQEEIITTILNGTDTIALLPTGGGKSICFQIPALILPGICLVVSPLIALMKDQTKQLRKRNIPAAYLNSTMRASEIDNCLGNLRQSKIKILYISPEKLLSKSFKDFLHNIKVSFIAVDEAHCVSQWGHSFRPEYLRIFEVKKILRVPVLALTATANIRCLEDIVQFLDLQNHLLFRSSFARKNIAIRLKRSSTKKSDLLYLLKKSTKPAIVYVGTRRRTKELHHFLSNANISSLPYHGGMQNKEREKNQDAWVDGKARVIIATNAFGMGIDKGDVDQVIHFDIPASLEAYYQEAGRAGRDGNAATATLLYNESDLLKLERNHMLRFPEEALLSEHYVKLHKYLKVPVNVGAGKSFGFSYRAYAAYCDQTSEQVFYILQTLEKLGIVHFSDAFMTPSQMMITHSSRDLFELYEQAPAYKMVIQVLLRNYEGLFTELVRINEEMIAQKIEKTSAELKAFLEKMHREHIINYIPQKGGPTITLKVDRMPERFFEFDRKKYRALQSVSAHQIKSIRSFIEQANCRQIALCDYLDEQLENSCGICDNCLAENIVEGTELQLEEALKTILEQPTTPQILIQHFPSHQHSIVKQILVKWTEEEMLISSNGKLSHRKAQL